MAALNRRHCNVAALHGPSFGIAHALLAMYVFSFRSSNDAAQLLVPPGRSAWITGVQMIWLHVGPVLLHWANDRVDQQHWSLQGPLIRNPSLWSTASCAYVPPNVIINQKHMSASVTLTKRGGTFKIVLKKEL